MNKKIIGVLSVAVLVIAIAGAYMFPKFVPSFGAESGPTHTQAQEFLGGMARGLVNATSSSVATYTLVANDIANPRQGAFYDTILFTKTGALSTTTWTFPASSTLSHVLPRAGQRTDMCIRVATTSASQVGLTLAAGTGWTFQSASTTPTDLTVNGGATVCGKIIREESDSNSFDFSFLLMDYEAAE